MRMHAIIDTHCHLDFAAFDDDRRQVLDACESQCVTDIVVPAVSQSTWSKTIEVCRNHSQLAQLAQQPQLHLALGLHPIFIDAHQPQHLVELDDLIGQLKTKQAAPIAVGEIGLDFYSKQQDQKKQREKQKVFFTKQLIIANQHQLPVIIHNRKAHDEGLLILQEIGSQGGIIHNFSGSIQHAHKYIELGFKLGFGGMLTFERSRIIRALAQQIPTKSIVLETDAPDLTVERHRGERNSPAYLPDVLQALAEVKQQPLAEIAEITSHNARDVLKLKPTP